MFSKIRTIKSTNNYSATIKEIKNFSNNVDAVIVGAGSGLSSAVGLTYTGTRFSTYFSDFQQKYGINDMYSGGFFAFPSPGERWAWWSRVIWLNRYQAAPKSTYSQLMNFLRTTNYFVLTTNVDHQFQQANVDKKRLFYTQGDYGLFQRQDQAKTFDNHELIKEMVLDQGFQIGLDRQLIIPADTQIKIQVNPDLVKQVQPFTLNLRVDDHFVEDAGWQQAALRFNNFMAQHQTGRVLFLELGVGMNTPGIIKYPFWNWTYNNPSARLVTVNNRPIDCPQEIQKQTTIIHGDLAEFIKTLN